MRATRNLLCLLAALHLACDEVTPPAGVEAQSCSSSADCKTASAPVCINHLCAPQPTLGTKGIGEACTMDGDCLTGLLCDQGKCDVQSQGMGAACHENDDCGSGLLCQNNHCAPGVAGDDGGAGCNDDGDCGSGQSCVGGQCVAGNASDDGGSSDDGGAGQACGAMGGGASCNDNGDCGAGGQCVMGQCAATTVACPSGQTCVNDVCQPIATADAGSSHGCHPVVNELQSGGASASDEWVELFNPCTAAIDLDGWKLVYRSAGNNGGGRDTLLVGLTQKIAAHGYLLFAGGGYSGSAPADGGWSSGHLASGGGAVGLRDGSGTLIDSVAYQTLTTKNNLTEGSAAPNPPAQSAIERLPNGADSDDNSKDFRVTASPTPRAANQ